MINIDFLDRVREIKHELNISKGRQKDKDRRRIAIYLTEAAFDYGLDVATEAPFFERRLYDLLKDMKLRCDPTSEEQRIKDKNIKNFDVLKLTLEPWSFPDMDFESYKYDDILKEVLEILTQEKEEVKDAREYDRELAAGAAVSGYY